MQIIFATHNKGKVMEARRILSEWEILSFLDLGITDSAVEDGQSFIENALKKARFAFQRTKQWSLAEDSGLCIRVLDGMPGIKSARWAGKNISNEKMIKKILQMMQNIPDKERGAYFESAVVLIDLQGKEWIFSGRVEGTIITTPRGIALPTLPYDVIFIPRGKDKTFAEMTTAEKNNLSHRGKAFQKLKDFLKTLPK